jgi:hypothetical protein
VIVFFPLVLQLAGHFEVSSGSRSNINTATDNEGDGDFTWRACVHAPGGFWLSHVGELMAEGSSVANSPVDSGSFTRRQLVVDE